jgi:hypothetical protein
MAQHEQLRGNHERSLEALENASAERKAELKERQESLEEYKDHESRASAERHKIEALFEEESGRERHHTNMDAAQPASSHRKQITQPERKASYKKTMYEIRTHMSPAQKAFSRFIHIPVVEKTSDAIGKTVARPNAILAGSFAAFILVAVVYVVARTLGYRLSGTETIAAFVAGWLIGVAYDFIKVMVTGRRSRI